jgi:hypothetical protein
VFKGCMNSIREQYLQDRKEEKEEERRKKSTKANVPQ